MGELSGHLLASPQIRAPRLGPCRLLVSAPGCRPVGWTKVLRESLQGTSSVLDPEGRFGDPLAGRTDWTPLERGGTNFRTHRLVRAPSGTLEFRPLRRARALPVLLGVLGVAAAALGVYAFFMLGDREAWIPMLVGVMFVGFGVFVWRGGSRRFVFDVTAGTFRVLFSARGPQSGSLREVAAIQLIAERVRGSKSTYRSYELNLVMRDASRVLVVDHGAIRRMREEAATLAAALRVPLWDATAPQA
jgi:hypothetical protein